MSQRDSYKVATVSADDAAEPNRSACTVTEISADWMVGRLTTPGSADNKYSRGAVLMATGSPTYPGAAVLGCLGAARAGTGYVRYLGPGRCEDLILSRLPEAVMGGGRSDAAVVGSGWDSSMASIADAVSRDCAQNQTPLVVDAGALAGAREWSQNGVPVIVTPHPGEAVSLMRQLAPEQVPSREKVERDPSYYAAVLAQLIGGIAMVKAAQTAVADPDGRLFVFTAPAGWGATAGAGDVLAGVVAACTASNEHLELVERVALGVGIHGLAAGIASGVLNEDLSASGVPGHPIVASDIAESVPIAIGALLAW